MSCLDTIKGANLGLVYPLEPRQAQALSVQACLSVKSLRLSISHAFECALELGSARNVS